MHERNKWFALIDGADVPGSLDEMLDRVDVGSLRGVRTVCSDENFLEYLRRAAQYATVFAESKRGFVAGRTLSGKVGVAGLDMNRNLLSDECTITFSVDGLEDQVRGNESLHPKVRRQVLALAAASKVVGDIGRPYTRYINYEGEGSWDLNTMSPARVIDFSRTDLEVIAQIKEALYVTRNI